jgi:hypothetical protein
LKPKIGGIRATKACFVAEGRPVKQKLRHLSPELQQELDRQLDDMLAAGVIRASRSPWGAVPVFVRKTTGEWRLCLDYRLLNDRLRGDSYPLPLLWQNLQRCAGHKWYTCLDANNGFWNLALDESSKPLTAFIEVFLSLMCFHLELKTRQPSSKGQWMPSLVIYVQQGSCLSMLTIW